MYLNLHLTPTKEMLCKCRAGMQSRLYQTTSFPSSSSYFFLLNPPPSNSFLFNYKPINRVTLNDLINARGVHLFSWSKLGCLINRKRCLKLQKGVYFHFIQISKLSAKISKEFMKSTLNGLAPFCLSLEFWNDCHEGVC